MEYRDSKYSQIEETLKAVGKTTFIDFYYDFKDTSVSSRDLAQKIFNSNPRAKSDNQNYRIARARHVFETKQEIEALKIIISSQKLIETTKEKAKQILTKEIFSKQSLTEFEKEQHFISDLNSNSPYVIYKGFEYDNSPKPAKSGLDITAHKYPRSRTVSQNALAKANYLCEVDSEHITFKRKNCDKNYTEPHHIVPLFAARDFPEIDLDREQNVISLCSNCHNWLHYGDDVDKILKPLFEKRKSLLEAIGVAITYEQLKSYY